MGRGNDRLARTLDLGMTRYQRRCILPQDSFMEKLNFLIMAPALATEEQLYMSFSCMAKMSGYTAPRQTLGQDVLVLRPT